MGYEQHVLQGRLTVRVVDRQGRTVDRIVQDNEIVDTGRTLIGRLLVGDAEAAAISHLAVGTDATAPGPTDVALHAEIESIDRAPIAWEMLADTIGMRVSAQVSSETDQDVSEAGLFNAAGHDEGVMYNRVTFPSPVPVGTDLDLVFEWDITF